MEVQELLKPRYKVIADWPSMRDFELNQTVVLDRRFANGEGMMDITDCQGTRSYIETFFNNYPHLFRKLDWWEEREPDHLPDYIKNRAGKVYVVSHYHRFNSYAIIEGEINKAKKINLKNFSPSDQQEYNNYINSNK